MQTDGKTVLNVLDRGGKANTSGLAVHVNQRPKPMAILYLLGGVAILVGLFWTLLKSTTVAPPTATPTAYQVVRPTQAATLGAVLGAVTVAPTVTPRPTETPAPTATPRPTSTPAPTATPLPDVWLSVASVVMPRKGWGNARTQSGLSPDTVAGWGLACPDELPLGARVQIPGRGIYTCIDRAKSLSCSGGVCKVLVFQSGLPLPDGLYPGYLTLPASWGKR